MSLRRALACLPDDRDSVTATRDIVAYLDRHQGESVDATGISRATGVSGGRIDPVLEALSQALVIDFDGEPLLSHYKYTPDPVLSLEVRRFLKASSGVDAGLQRRVDRFRGHYGR